MEKRYAEMLDNPIRKSAAYAALLLIVIQKMGNGLRGVD